MKLISIIVPCYNQAEYLNECLNSLLDQSQEYWECIIVNDGSTDETEEISKKWCEKDDRFKYYYKENGGLSSARNFGVSYSNGELILPLDADDKIGVTYIETASKIFDDNPNVLICAPNAILFGEINNPWTLPNYDFKTLLLGNLFFCSSVFKKENFVKVSGFDESMKNGLEDWEFWIRMCSLSGVIVPLNGDYFYYRQKNKSMIRDLELNMKMMEQTRFYIFKKHLDLYHSNFGNPLDIIINAQNKVDSSNAILKKYINWFR